MECSISRTHSFLSTKNVQTRCAYNAVWVAVCIQDFSQGHNQEIGLRALPPKFSVPLLGVPPIPPNLPPHLGSFGLSGNLPQSTAILCLALASLHRLSPHIFNQSADCLSTWGKRACGRRLVLGTKCPLQPFLGLATQASMAQQVGKSVLAVIWVVRPQIATGHVSSQAMWLSHAVKAAWAASQSTS